MGTPFKMKGSPMQRNFGISPVKQTDEWVNPYPDERTPEQIEEDKKKEEEELNKKRSEWGPDTRHDKNPENLKKETDPE